MITRIYHITKFQDNSSYIFFNGCNWNCNFCIMKKYKFDIHWSEKQDLDLNLKYLSVEDAIEILRKNKIMEVFLGGGEPTIDPSLKDFLKILKSEEIRINILTNGELLEQETVSLVDRIAFSIKTLDNSIHEKLVHRSNARALENLKKFFNDKFTFETVYLNELGCKNVMDIARFIENLRSGLTLRVDPLIPINDDFSAPDINGVEKCIDLVSKMTSVKTFRIIGKGKNAELLYPLEFRKNK
ncbi:MAG: radical SAM protein [Thermoplasmata archaeon]